MAFVQRKQIWIHNPASVQPGGVKLDQNFTIIGDSLESLAESLAQIELTPGPQGVSGYSGVNGQSGISGYSGRDASIGASGASGQSGYSGQNGTSGAPGASGVSGYSGASGLVGLSGASGYSGLSPDATIFYPKAGGTITGAVTAPAITSLIYSTGNTPATPTNALTSISFVNGSGNLTPSENYLEWQLIAVGPDGSVSDRKYLASTDDLTSAAGTGYTTFKINYTPTPNALRLVRYNDDTGEQYVVATFVPSGSTATAIDDNSIFDEFVGKSAQATIRRADSNQTGTTISTDGTVAAGNLQAGYISTTGGAYLYGYTYVSNLNVGSFSGTINAYSVSAQSATFGHNSTAAFQSDWNNNQGIWLNFDTAHGPAGIGSGGAGANAWIGYSSAPGNWFANAATGDICYRNTTANAGLRFGTSASGSQLYLTVEGGVAVTDKMTATADIDFLTAGKGIILRSPDGTRYRVTVANGGTLTTTAI